LRIVVLGAGVQGTVFGVRLANAGHRVTLISRPERAIELRQGGATIQDLKTMRVCTKVLPMKTTVQQLQQVFDMDASYADRVKQSYARFCDEMGQADPQYLRE
jgi:ketopantoate reductase